MKKKEEDGESRRYQLTINNPAEKGFTDETISERLATFPGLSYYCFAGEVGEQGTPHVHIYVVFKSPVRFSTVKKRFDGQAHIEKCAGTSEQNRAYILKSAGTEGSTPFVEFGECPRERQGRPCYLDDLYGLIKVGYSDYQLFESNPSFIRHVNQIGKVREAVAREEAKTARRSVSMTYIHADPMADPMAYILERRDIGDCYRVTDYNHPFDFYGGEKVLILWAYKDGLPLQDLLLYCGPYPVQLPARYSNRWSAFEEIVIVSMAPLEEQYTAAQYEDRRSYAAFLSKIDKVVALGANGEVAEHTIKDYFDSTTKTTDNFGGFGT